MQRGRERVKFTSRQRNYYFFQSTIISTSSSSLFYIRRAVTRFMQIRIDCVVVLMKTRFRDIRLQFMMAAWLYYTTTEWTHLSMLSVHLFSSLLFGTLSGPLTTNSSLCVSSRSCIIQMWWSDFLFFIHFKLPFMEALLIYILCECDSECLSVWSELGVAISNSIFYPLWRSSRQKVLTYFNYYFPFASIRSSFRPSYHHLVLWSNIYGIMPEYMDVGMEVKVSFGLKLHVLVCIAPFVLVDCTPNYGTLLFG